MDCLFCKIINKSITANIIYETDLLVAFTDIRPQAPQHILIVPKRHIATLNDIKADDKSLIGDMYLAATKIATDLGIADNGYRTVFNCNAAGGQEVYHIHLHLLGGRQMSWPPG